MNTDLREGPLAGLQGVVREPALRTISPEDYRSPDVPEGYETVPHWWFDRENEAVDLLVDPLGTFYSAAEELQTICEERGIKFAWVTASPAYTDLGLDRERAFPTWLLADYYPLNP